MKGKKLGGILMGTALGAAAIFASVMFTGCGAEAVKDGISIYSSFETNYYVGDQIDIAGGIINFTENGETKQVVITNDMISGFTSAKAGTRNLVITYGNYTKTVSYTVKDYPENVDFSAIFKSQEEQIGMEGYYCFIKFSENKVFITSTEENYYELGFRTGYNYETYFDRRNEKWVIEIDNSSFGDGNSITFDDIKKDSFTLVAFAQGQTVRYHMVKYSA